MLLFDKAEWNQTATRIWLVAEITTYLPLARQDLIFFVYVWGEAVKIPKNLRSACKVLAQLNKHLLEWI